MPVEWWEEDDLTYLVFDLIDEGNSVVPSMALFVVDAGLHQLGWVRIIRPNEDATVIEATDIQSAKGV